MSNVDASRLSVPYPIHSPLTETSTVESADPISSRTRRGRHARGTRNRRRYTPVGLSSGTAGGSATNGMITFV
jgi:hypothetical protein